MADNALLEAAKTGRVEELKKLLDGGPADADVDLALLWTGYCDQPATARLLIDYGADLSFKASSKSAYDYAVEKNFPEMKKLLSGATQQPRGKPLREKWVPMGESSVAFVGNYPELGKKLSQVFNFETRERFLISENLNTKSEGVAPATSFDDLPQEAVEKALGEFERLGGKPDRDFVLRGASSLGKPKKPLLEAPNHG